MERLGTKIATHVVRNHRSLRRRIPDLARLGEGADGQAPERTRVRSAQQAAEFLDRNVLAHADVEDVLVHRYLEGRAIRGSAARLQTQHDTLREATARLHDYVDEPAEQMDVTGMVQGLGRVLHGHLDDEWRVLLPVLSALDEEACTVCEPLVEGGAVPRPSARLFLSVPFESAQSLLIRRSSDLRDRVSEAATATVRRIAQRLDIPLRSDLGIAVELEPAVQSRRVGLHVGTLTSQEFETVISPVEFEVVLCPRGDRSTELEVHHTVTPAREVPTGAPPHELTEAAVHAVIGELAGIAAGRSAAVTAG